MAQGPCLNPSCSSQGRPHPNCRCYSHMAEGGQAGCNGPHDPKCVHHMPADPSDIFSNAVAHHGLSNLIKQTSKTDLDVDNKNPYRAFDGYLGASRKGSKQYSKSIKNIFGSEKHKLSGNAENLNNQLENFKLNPSSAIEAGSAVGLVSPEHGIDLSSTIGNATNYLDSIKPKAVSGGALSNPLPISGIQKQMYDRQVGIVEQPLSALSHVKNGSLTPQDVKTLNLVYPKLYEKLKHSVGEEIIETKAAGKSIPYNTVLGLSALLGSPLDSTMEQSSMQAAMVANAPKVPQEPQGKTKKPSKPSLAQQEKLNGMYATETQKLQEGKD